MMVAAGISAGTGALPRLPDKLRDSGVSEEQWGMLVAAGDVKTLRQGDVLFREGEVVSADDKEVYVILEGGARIEVRGNVVARLKPGCFLGEASYLSKTTGPRTASVRADSRGMQPAEDSGAQGVGLAVLVWRAAALRKALKESGAEAAVLERMARDLASKLQRSMRELELRQGPLGSVDDSALQELGSGEPNEKQHPRGHDYGFRDSRATELFGTATPVSGIRLGLWNFQREYAALRRSFRFGEFSGPQPSSAGRRFQSIDLPFTKTFQEIDQWLESNNLFNRILPSKAETPEALTPEEEELRRKLENLTLSNEAVAKLEEKRREATSALVKEVKRKGLKEEADSMSLERTPWFIMLPYLALCRFLDVVFEDRPIQRFWFLETVARMPYFSYISMLHLYETLGWWGVRVGSDVRKVHFAEEW